MLSLRTVCLDEEDTSYFDTRADRYNHELDEEHEDLANASLISNLSAVDADSANASSVRSTSEDTDDNQSMFASFTSASPRCVENRLCVLHLLLS
jgi:hypothetical protein